MEGVGVEGFDFDLGEPAVGGGEGLGAAVGGFAGEYGQLVGFYLFPGDRNPMRLVPEPAGVFEEGGNSSKWNCYLSAGWGEVWLVIVRFVLVSGPGVGRKRLDVAGYVFCGCDESFHGTGDGDGCFLLDFGFVVPSSGFWVLAG